MVSRRGGRGIGRSIARALTRAVTVVTVLGRYGVALDDDVAAGDVAAGDVAAGRAKDVTDRGAFWAAVADQEWGILMDNADAAETNKLADTGRDQWNRMIALNRTAVFDACQAVLPGVMARGAKRVAIAVAARTGRDVADIRASTARTSPVGRLIDPDDVADAVLISYRADAMTGQALAVAGGDVMP